MTPAPYDTKEGIASYLTDLAGFHRLLEHRRQAVTERNEKLDQFIVLNYWFLDSSGQFSDLKLWMDPGHSSHIQDALAPVVRLQEAKDLFGLGVGHRVTWGAVIPPVGYACSECGREWTLDTLVDHVHTRLSWEEKEAFFHKSCWAFRKAHKEHAYFQDRLTQAGFTKFYLSEIPNEYDPKGLDLYRCPWFNVHTVWGTLKIGWGRSDITVNWEGTGREFKSQSMAPPTYIGAHYNEMFAAYLKEPQCVPFLKELREFLAK